MRVKRKNIVSLLGLFLFLYLLCSIGIEKIIKTFISVNFFHLLLSLLVFIPISLLQTLRWQLLLKSNNIQTSLTVLFPLYLKGLFYGLVTPGKLGSFARIYLLREKLDCSLTKASVSVILDRLSDFLSLSLLALIGGFVILKSTKLPFFLIMLFFIAFVALLLFFTRWQRIFSLLLTFLAPPKLKSRAKKKLKIFFASIPSLKRLILPYVLGLISWILIYFQAYLIALGLNISLSFFHFSTVTPISTLVGFIPITISGFGTRDATFIGLMSLLGINSAEAISLSLLGYTVNAIVPGIYGGIITFAEFFIKKES